MSFLSSLLGLDAKIKSAETDIYNNVYTKKQADGQFVTKIELTAKNYATQDYVSAQNYASKDDVKYSMQNYAYSKSEIDAFLKALNDRLNTTAPLSQPKIETFAVVPPSQSSLQDFLGWFTGTATKESFEAPKPRPVWEVDATSMGAVPARPGPRWWSDTLPSH